MTTGVDFWLSSMILARTRAPRNRRAVEHGRGGQQVDVVGRLAHQAVQHGLVELGVRADGVSDVRRILVEIETGVPNGKSRSRISVSWGRLWLMAHATLRATVEGRPPLAAMKPMVRPMGSSAPGGEQLGDGRDGLRRGRQHDVFGDADGSARDACARHWRGRAR